MRHLTTFFASLIFLTFLFACNGSRGNENNEAARQLFIKSRYLTEEYIDSIKLAKDSASLNRMVENFNIKLTTVNYEFPPDTDLDITEEENDSLIRMFTRFKTTVDDRLKGFAQKNSPDSISKDSVAVKPTANVGVKPVAVSNDTVKKAALPSHSAGN